MNHVKCYPTSWNLSLTSTGRVRRHFRLCLLRSRIEFLLCVESGIAPRTAALSVHGQPAAATGSPSVARAPWLNWIVGVYNQVAAMLFMRLLIILCSFWTAIRWPSHIFSPSTMTPFVVQGTRSLGRCKCDSYLSNHHVFINPKSRSTHELESFAHTIVM